MDLQLLVSRMHSSGIMVYTHCIVTTKDAFRTLQLSNPPGKYETMAFVIPQLMLSLRIGDTRRANLQGLCPLSYDFSVYDARENGPKQQLLWLLL